ncbi:hypothetical protein SS05631_c36710 [Sinorhizobium sp. CCBAU 05631]|nr:hypothetical protein SS05631_c36710 [Sinorhizobium sp. CCBAU 05631]
MTVCLAIPQPVPSADGASRPRRKILLFQPHNAAGAGFLSHNSAVSI